MSKNKTIFHNALIVNEGSVTSGYIVIEGDTIVEVGNGPLLLSQALANSTTVVDCRGDMIMPGVIDTHVHFRDPGLTHKADISTESAAAVAGGVTSYMDMPNTNPATVTLEAWENKMKHAAE
ncbi:MAG: amidohydrolase family protein, partial [Muribaculaceae bacterium]|nr:amidohydrolase family protein [Muribaculaceae bacterium]